MRISTGIDMVLISRIEKHLSDEKGTFITRCFTPEEMRYCDGLTGKRRAESYAARFAAKEAAAKALGTGVMTEGIGLTDFEIIKEEKGAPRLEFRGRALEEARRLNVTSASISLTHEGEYAIASCALLMEDCQ